MDEFSNSINKEAICNFDFTGAGIPELAKMHTPTLYKEGDSYCCVLGPDPVEGVFGCGKSPIEAVEDWSNNYIIKYPDAKG